MAKTLDEHFRDWEGEAFGYGYGMGERPILKALKSFADLTHPNQHGYTYDHRELEDQLGPTITWLLINALCNDHAIEYGSSPRFGWFYKHGKVLIDYLRSHTAEELYEVATDYDEGYIHCYKWACNCGPYDNTGPSISERCPHNPFWEQRKQEG